MCFDNIRVVRRASNICGLACQTVTGWKNSATVYPSPSALAVQGPTIRSAMRVTMKRDKWRCPSTHFHRLYNLPPSGRFWLQKVQPRSQDSLLPAEAKKRDEGYDIFNKNALRAAFSLDCLEIRLRNEEEINCTRNRIYSQNVFYFLLYRRRYFLFLDSFSTRVRDDQKYVCGRRLYACIEKLHHCHRSIKGCT